VDLLIDLYHAGKPVILLPYTLEQTLQAKCAEKVMEATVLWPAQVTWLKEAMLQILR